MWKSEKFNIIHAKGIIPPQIIISLHIRKRQQWNEYHIFFLFYFSCGVRDNIPNIDLDKRELVIDENIFEITLYSKNMYESHGLDFMPMLDFVYLLINRVVESYFNDQTV